MKIDFDKWYVAIDFGDVRSVGIGWWVRGHWKRRGGWFQVTHAYYDGNWFGVRLGPFFYIRGSY